MHIHCRASHAVGRPVSCCADHATHDCCRSNLESNSGGGSSVIEFGEGWWWGKGAGGGDDRGRDRDGVDGGGCGWGGGGGWFSVA